MSLILLRAGTRLPPLCGASNTRIVAELGLIVPSEARIRYLAVLLNYVYEKMFLTLRENS